MPVAMIREPVESDVGHLLRINADCQPAVGPMDADKLEFFLRNSPHFRVLLLDDEPAGLLIVLTQQETGYTSPNYHYFRARHEQFAYIDRIALAVPARRGGWGRKLYDELEVWARKRGFPLLCAEVNTIPDNPQSRGFHRQCGFTEVERCRPYGPQSEVVMLEKNLA